MAWDGLFTDETYAHARPGYSDLWRALVWCLLHARGGKRSANLSYGLQCVLHGVAIGLASRGKSVHRRAFSEDAVPLSTLVCADPGAAWLAAARVGLSVLVSDWLAQPDRFTIYLATACGWPAIWRGYRLGNRVGGNTGGAIRAGQFKDGPSQPVGRISGNCQPLFRGASAGVAGRIAA